jgi:hypothetical protein
VLRNVSVCVNFMLRQMLVDLAIKNVYFTSHVEGVVNLQALHCKHYLPILLIKIRVGSRL